MVRIQGRTGDEWAASAASWATIRAQGQHRFAGGPYERFPSGLGTDLAGEVVAVGSEVTSLRVSADVLGWTEERTAEAEFVAVPATQLVPKPATLSWEAAGVLFGSSMAGRLPEGEPCPWSTPQPTVCTVPEKTRPG